MNENLHPHAHGRRGAADPGWIEADPLEADGVIVRGHGVASGTGNALSCLDSRNLRTLKQIARLLMRDSA